MNPEEGGGAKNVLCRIFFSRDNCPQELFSYCKVFCSLLLQPFSLAAGYLWGSIICRIFLKFCAGIFLFFWGGGELSSPLRADDPLPISTNSLLPRINNRSLYINNLTDLGHWSEGIGTEYRRDWRIWINWSPKIKPFTIAKKKEIKWHPSGIAFSVKFLVPLSFRQLKIRRYGHSIPLNRSVQKFPSDFVLNSHFF